MASRTDWQAWHESYRDQHSPLSRRLRVVQAHIARWLDERPGEAVRVVSACAGQGDDLIGVLARRGRRERDCRLSAGQIRAKVRGVLLISPGKLVLRYRPGRQVL